MLEINIFYKNTLYVYYTSFFINIHHILYITIYEYIQYS